MDAENWVTYIRCKNVSNYVFLTRFEKCFRCYWGEFFFLIRSSAINPCSGLQVRKVILHVNKFHKRRFEMYQINPENYLKCN